MKKILVSLLMILSFCFCNGQSGESYIQRTVDSLDQIQPLNFNKVKPQGRSFTIKVRNQQEFEELNESIVKALESGRTNIRVKLGKGTYHFKENHISLKGVHKNVAITIVGKKAVLTSCEDLRDVDNEPWQDMVQVDGLIEVVDRENNLCMIPFSNLLNKETQQTFTKVQVTQWFRAPVYDVERIHEKGIYFYAKDLVWEKNYGRKGYNVNLDYLILGKYPRFRLYDKSKSLTATSSCFLRMENTEDVMVEISYIAFKGNKSGRPLIAMSNVKSRQVYIHDCVFEWIHDNVGNFSNVKNVTFDHNMVKNTDGHEVRFVKNCENVRVTNNLFENCGQSIGNTFCVTCWESSYYIANNTFRDFGYSAIGAGVWHGFAKEYPSRGIVENNEICFSDAYFANKEKYTLMDAGGIYVWTQNDCVIIRYNYIHDYGGIGYNSGIYCDDGASNCKIYRNVVLNTPDGFSISSRKVKDQKASFKNNSNNFMADNVMDGAILFDGYGAEERHCVKGANYVIQSTGNLTHTTKMAGLEVNIEDVEVDEKWVKKRVKKLIKSK